MDKESSSILSPSENTEVDNSFCHRPRSLDEFLGQESMKNNLKTFINASKSRNVPMDHVIMHGPPGLGKSSIGYIIAKELNVNIHTTSGPLLTKAGDLAAILTNIQEGDTLFIDEIHRLNIAVEELLYSAMEDFVLDIMIGEGPAAKSIRIDIPKFTLVGATTRMGLISGPLRDRFGIQLKLDFYKPEELEQIIIQFSRQNNMEIDYDALQLIARCSRGTPRIALRLTRRIFDFACIDNAGKIDHPVTINALQNLQINSIGLDKNDMDYMNFLYENKETPVGIETISAALSEQKNNVIETIEQYLIKIGFVLRTPRGRLLTEKAIKYIEEN